VKQRASCGAYRSSGMREDVRVIPLIIHPATTGAHSRIQGMTDRLIAPISG